MTFSEYQENCMKFASDISKATNENLLLQGVMGMCGEASEVLEIVNFGNVYIGSGNEDIEHLAKELGDVLWYAATASTAIGHEMKQPISNDLRKHRISNLVSNRLRYPIRIMINAGRAIDIVKKMTFQGHPINDETKVDIVTAIDNIVECVDEVSFSIGYSIEEIMEMNIEKLSKRYASGHFSKEESLHRKEGDV